MSAPDRESNCRGGPFSFPPAPEEAEAESFQLILTAGADACDRAAYALQVAVMAACGGNRVIVHLVLDGTHWACRRDELNSAEEEVIDLLEKVLQLDGEVECCSRCASEQCAPGTGTIHEENLREGIRLAGISSWMERTSRGTRTVTF